MVQTIANSLHVNNSFYSINLCNYFNIFYCICFLYFFLKVIIYFNKKISTYNHSIENNKISNKQKLFLLVIAVITITLFSKSSFLYPLNDWVDANCFFTVGKSILSGKVPYRDLMEQKGPLLYFIHALAALISYDSFIGVYLIEIIACYFFLYYAYKILLIFVDKYCIYLLPFLSVLIHSSTSFCHGDSAEELCLPLITYGLYLGLLHLKNNELSFKESIMLGITSGCVLWIKFTMLGFYIGWIIVPFVLSIRNKTYLKFFKMLFQIIFGVIIITIPILSYFIYHSALNNLFSVYFYNNLFLYNSSNESSLLSNEIHSLLSGVYKNIQYYIFTIVGVYGLWVKYKKEFIFLVSTFIFTAFFVYVGADSWPYYTFIMSVFSVAGLFTVYILINDLLKKTFFNFRGMIIYIFSICAILFLCVIKGSNTYLMFEDKDNLPQYQFKEIICSIENPTLLNYGWLDGCFYTTTGIVPNCKYFCELNISLDEMYDGQKECIENGDVDFVVSDKVIEEELIEKYELVSTASYYFEGTMKNYYLYQLIN